MELRRKVLIFGAGGRVGQHLASALLRRAFDVIAVDCLPSDRLQSIVARLVIDARVSQLSAGQAKAVGDFDVQDRERVSTLLNAEKPDVVVNYAIPFTWDATKQLPNYHKISAAGLGAFAAVQALAPKVIAECLHECGLVCPFVVGNLPDITIPILHGLGSQRDMALPIAGAGNVGLIEAGLKQHLVSEHQLNAEDLQLFLVAHHVHWVAPREPGYPNDAPFLLKIVNQGEDITHRFDDLRSLMNTAINAGYEAGAGFSSTTGLLAAQLVVTLLDDSGAAHPMHTPAPNGLPGGYPVVVGNGKVEVALPEDWSLAEAVTLMKQAHQKDGIDKIGEDGSIHFQPESVRIVKTELQFDLPRVVAPDEIEQVAKAQIQAALRATTGR